ncbi:WD40 repeat-like protein [Xylariaceae sp. FL0594]|nr:WD40 repeat-like protein [Xylariaceae sp. FL0594]
MYLLHTPIHLVFLKSTSLRGSRDYPAVHQVEVADRTPQFPISAIPSAPDELSTPPAPRQSPSTIISAVDAELLPAVAAVSDSFLLSPGRADLSPDRRQQQLELSSVPSQILGRRRRASGDDGAEGTSHSQAITILPAIPEPHPAKRRRAEPTMLADADGLGATNGKPKSHANEKPTLRSPGSSATNGAHKSGSGSNGVSRSRPPEVYLGHNREEVTRLLIQTLSEMGYTAAAQSVCQESGYELEKPTVASFRTAILHGDWDEAERLLDGSVSSSEAGGQVDNGLVLADGANPIMMRFYIRQQKYLELLELNEHSQALAVLRNELTPLQHNHTQAHFLSSLIMCQTGEELRLKACWDGAEGRSRQMLLSDLSKCISPSVMLPEHRLALLLEQVKQAQVSNCLFHCNNEPLSLYSDHKCRQEDFPAETVIELDDHDGEVWQIVFSHDGTKLASCGEDKQVFIWEVPSFKILHVLEEHGDGVGNVSWSWDDSMLVSCSKDGYARLWDVATGKLLQRSRRFGQPVSSCVWSTDGRSYVTGVLDLTDGLVQWDLSGQEICNWIVPHRVEELALSPDGCLLVAMDDQTHIYVYDFATRMLLYKLDMKVRLSSLCISWDSKFVLVNQTNGVAQLIDLIKRAPVQQYTGHKGGNYMIRSTLGGAHECFAISGCEDGFIHIWHKTTGHAVQKLLGHSPRCNSVSWCPNNGRLFASWSNNGWWRDRFVAQSRQQTAASRS